jgi:glyoxylase-like metal-dependent hydrolase (beta-lactamase superfamily II)
VLERLALGSTEITVVCEGYAPLDLADELPNVDWGAERDRYPWAFHDEHSSAWHVHAFALRMPTGLVLIDTGVSPLLPIRPWAEHTPLEEAFTAARVDPADVATVIHTHLHADHAGGAVVAGEPRFPNAIHVAHPADWEHFGRVGGYTARSAMERLAELDMLDLDPEDREVRPRLSVVHAPGHTPGHRVAVLSDGTKTMLFTGDLLHVPVQVRRTNEPSNHDVDDEEGARSRRDLLGRAREEGWDVAVSHFGHPFGRVGPDGWKPRPRPEG